jgi:type II secretory ATPase GspE/PulE/Tfp pilus assembly ATPase PilB-like protein
VSAIPPGVSAGRIEDTVDIHQDQRLHASTVRARQAGLLRRAPRIQASPRARVVLQTSRPG